jgi:hypothetical protein
MTDKLAELESFQINFQHAMNIEREESKAERDKLYVELGIFQSLAEIREIEADKLAGQVREAKELLQTAFDVLTVTEDDCDKDWVSRTKRLLAETEQAG